MSLRLHRALFAGALAGLAQSAVVHAQSRDTMTVRIPAGSLSMLAVGDWGREGSRDQRAVALQMGRTAEQLGARLVLSLGDNFYDAGVRSVTDPQWQRSFEQVYNAPALQVPWYAVLGNHDYRGVPQAEVAYTATSRRWRMPARYYTITEPVAPGVTVQLWFLDTSPFIAEYRDEPRKYAVAETDTVAQRRWLDSTLAASTATWKILVGHHNVYSGGKRPVLVEMERFLTPRLSRYGVLAYLCGHEHQLEHIVPNAPGPHYLISGAGSETRRATGMRGTRFVTSDPGFLALSVGRDSVWVQAIDRTGAMRYRTALTRPLTGISRPASPPGTP